MKNLLSGLPDMLIFFVLYGFLIIGIYITVKLLKHLGDKSAKNKMALFITLLFNALNFYIIYDLMTVSPQISSGNGNPFIPYIFISFLLFIFLCIVLSKRIFDTLLKRNILVSLLIVSVALFLGYLSFVFQLDFISMIKSKINYPINNW
ncbi:hypothetical protein QNH47_10300 [Virgibacillus halodenitrificans]|uniref:hypothetical protein n=1 Tax=Virgibacillus halodenitrificans TaxID=1482 RepID=UPI0024C04F5B|nr:hypothetical protein [Virgibacillus halodenitrificans]WHX24586.1 hypothetical protein QNH47_10300 [Virgibacillus halodenitrificans]